MSRRATTSRRRRSSGDNSETTVRQFVSALNAGTPGDAKAGLRVFKGRPHVNLVQSYGPEFAKALTESEQGTVARPADARRLARDAAQRRRRRRSRPIFEALRGVVLHDWTDATAAEQRTAAVRALARKYTVKHEVAADHDE